MSVPTGAVPLHDLIYEVACRLGRIADDPTYSADPLRDYAVQLRERLDAGDHDPHSAYAQLTRTLYAEGLLLGTNKIVVDDGGSALSHVGSDASTKRPRCRVCGGGVPSLQIGQTYVVQRERWVKIGVSMDVETRLRSLATVPKQVILPRDMDPRAPLVLVGLPDDDEHPLHERWAAHHVAGEWFDVEPLAAWTASL